MKKLLLASAMIGLFSIAAAADANAWTRSATTTAPRGTATVQAQGSCTYGSCTRNVTRTGPGGNTYTRTGTVYR